MMIFWFVLIGVMIYILLSKSGKNPVKWVKTGEGPTDVLKKRFVNGEITEDEYKKMLKLLND
ncbi:MAG TPA: hypothetical protein P5075_10265 [Eubacteriales bacterium]|nr:hypothetical protein [Eubacteriales bacterium]